MRSMSASQELTKKKCQFNHVIIIPIVFLSADVLFTITYVLGDVSNRGGGTNPANSRRSLGLAASAKILTRAANWRAKSLQAKTERRERRATKTLAIVLGMLQRC